MAANPFPGMDPWFETVWGDTHARLIVYAADQLQSQLPPDLRAYAETTARIGAPGPAHGLKPDTSVAEYAGDDDPDVDSLLTDGEGGGTTAVISSAVLPKPLVLPLPSDEKTKRWIAIRERGSSARLVTAVELLSPWNKQIGQGRRDYVAKRERFLADDVSVVEVDLVRAGRPVLSRLARGAPALPETAYRACVYRSYLPDQAEYYPIPLRDPLPAIPVPLRSYDPADVVLELQPLIDEAYTKAAWRRSLHRVPLDPPLSPDDAAWAAERVGLNETTPRP